MNKKRSNPITPLRQAVSVNEFCEIWGIGRTLFYKLKNTGQIQTISAGSRTLIPCRQEVEVWNSCPPVQAAMNSAAS